MKLVIHVDNRVVAHPVSDRTMRGAFMSLLCRCLLLASKYKLNLEAGLASRSANVLPDALSRSHNDRIADLAPQLLEPTYNLQ